MIIRKLYWNFVSQIFMSNYNNVAVTICIFYFIFSISVFTVVLCFLKLYFIRVTTIATLDPEDSLSVLSHNTYDTVLYAFGGILNKNKIKFCTPISVDFIYFKSLNVCKQSMFKEDIIQFIPVVECLHFVSRLCWTC